MGRANFVELQRRLQLGAVAVFVAVAGGTSCGENDSTENEPPLWPADFDTLWPEVRDCRLSPAAHDGFYIRVFADPDAEVAYVDGTYPFAEGTRIVKAGYDDEQCIKMLHVWTMEKLAAGADPELNDWRWQRTDAEGKVSSVTPARSCAGCHDACAANDFTCAEP